MVHYIELSYAKNYSLFIFGCCNLIASLVFLLLTQLSGLRMRGTNTWYKPFKFALSIAIFSLTMGWYTYELHAPKTVTIYNWIIISLLGFEVIYIAIQAFRGQLSHYNFSSSLYEHSCGNSPNQPDIICELSNLESPIKFKKLPYWELPFSKNNASKNPFY